MACTGAFATAAQFKEIWRSDTLDLTNPDVLTEVELGLDFYAAKMHIVLASVNACDCTYPAWAANYLAQLNCIGAAVIYKVSCGPALTDEAREMYITYTEERLAEIKDGTTDICGETGKDYPAIGWAEMGLTDKNAAQIIINRERRKL